MKVLINVDKVRTVKGEAGDCGVVAVGIASGLGYHTAWKVFRTLGRRKGEGVSARMITRAVEILGFTSSNYITIGNSITLAKFLKTHKRGRFIAYTKDHAISVIDGKMFDAVMTHGKTHVIGFITLED